MDVKKQGFTLIELMIVIVIIGILATIAVPRLFNVTEKAGDAEIDTFAVILRSGLNTGIAEWMVAGMPADAFTFGKDDEGDDITVTIFVDSYNPRAVDTIELYGNVDVSDQLCQRFAYAFMNRTQQNYIGYGVEDNEEGTCDSGAHVWCATSILEVAGDTNGGCKYEYLKSATEPEPYVCYEMSADAGQGAELKGNEWSIKVQEGC